MSRKVGVVTLDAVLFLLPTPTVQEGLILSHVKESLPFLHTDTHTHSKCFLLDLGKRSLNLLGFHLKLMFKQPLEAFTQPAVFPLSPCQMSRHNYDVAVYHRGTVRSTPRMHVPFQMP